MSIADPDRLYHRLLNAKLRLRLIAEGKWPAPKGWALTLHDLGLDDEPQEDDPEGGIAARFAAQLQQALDEGGQDEPE